MSDDSGRPLPSLRRAERVVSLSPAITELFYDLEVEHALVGRTRWADYPPQADDVPSVGDGLSPNVEMILARRPDLVVFYASPSNELAIATLEGLGIASVSLRVDRLADLARGARILGRLTGSEERADSLAGRLMEWVSEVEDAGVGENRPSVLIPAWDSPPIVVGGGSFLSEIVELAGGANSFGDIERPSLTTSVETIVDRNPDLVLVASDSGIPTWTERPEWQAVAAVRERRFVVVQGSEFSRPSFRVRAAVRQLRDALREWRR